MMSTAMSRSLPSYSRAWCPQKTRSLPLASTTRTLASAPQRSQWKGTTKSSAGGVVVSVWVISSSLALYRTDPRMRIGLLHSARMAPRVPVPTLDSRGLAERDESVTDGVSGGAGSSRGRHLEVLPMVLRAGRGPPSRGSGRSWVRCCLDGSHATPSTRTVVGSHRCDPREVVDAASSGRRQGNLLVEVVAQDLAA